MSLYNEIAHYFEGKDYSEVIYALNEERFQNFVSHLRDDLTLCGKKCSMYRHMIQELDKEKPSSESRTPWSEIERRWLELTRGHRKVYELLGYAILLKMDAESMVISLLSVSTDTERIVVCKHSYTIVAEARNKNLFTSLAGGMRVYPEELLTKKEYDTLWKESKKLVKWMTRDSLSNRIRNAIDAHKKSFVEQLDAYSTVDWRQSLMDMLTIIQVVSNVEKCLDKIHGRLRGAFDSYEKDTRAYVAKLDEILKKLESE